MSFYVYMLECCDGSFYTGHTDDLDARVAAHRLGHQSAYTRKRRPVRLVFAAEFATRDEAFGRERQIKGWCRAKKRALMSSDWARLQELSRQHGARGAHGSTGSP